MKTEQEKLREHIPLTDEFLAIFFHDRNLPYHYDDLSGLWVGFEPLKEAAEFFKTYY